MSDRRSVRLYELSTESAEKFDYFLVGLAAALAAYLGRDLNVGKLGWNPETIATAALVAFVLSVGAGLIRLELRVTILGVASRRLEHQESAGKHMEASAPGNLMINQAAGTLHTPDDLREAARKHHHRAEGLMAEEKKLADRALAAYRWRDRLLVSGLGLLALSRVVAGS
ncbi:MAG: hypothetical protein IT352_04075 [Gemmatimonadales bacterium]|nr:hypothetical protein [Gemmatimonadales bacterium]